MAGAAMAAAGGGEKAWHGGGESAAWRKAALASRKTAYVARCGLGAAVENVVVGYQWHRLINDGGREVIWLMAGEEKPNQSVIGEEISC